MAGEVLAEPCELGMGPITGDDGSAAGAAGAAGSGFGADLQAAISAAVALAATASSQNLRGARRTSVALDCPSAEWQGCCLMFYLVFIWVLLVAWKFKFNYLLLFLLFCLLFIFVNV